MKYFIPEWGDLVDPRYDFITDTYSKEHSENPWKNDHYIWDIFGIENVPLDGVLVSRTKLEENKKKISKIMDSSIHSFLHLPAFFEIIGDCGAFGYIEQDEPIFETKDTLDFYVKLGLNVGVSIDHLIVPKFKEQNQARWNLTIENAREMYDYWNSKDDYKFKLRIMGVAQGWDTISYSKAVHELLNIGYNYIGIGGLTRAPSGNIAEFGTSKTVSNVVRAVCYEVKKWNEKHKTRVDIHIFGFARTKLIEEFQKMGVTSFDSASFFRSAWLSGKNYFTGKKDYKAIRVPNPKRTRSRRVIEEEIADKGMHVLRKYEKDPSFLEQALDTIKKIGELADINPSHIKGYEEVLLDRPWEKCDCPICKQYGIETVIFRGNERNRRRGFHNTYVFYETLRKIVPKVLVFTSCTGTKDKSEGLINAYRRYLLSPLFKTFWNQTYDLPVEIKILSAKYGLIDWSSQIPDYDKKMAEEDVDRFKEELLMKFPSYDKIFFIGLGFYRETVEHVKVDSSIDIEIFPKMDLTSRKALDVIEYTKQMIPFRNEIVKYIGESYDSSELFEGYQKTIKSFLAK